MSAVHGTFTITRELPHSPERVYAAWSDPKIVYAHSMHVDEQKISVSLATIALEPAKVGGKSGAGSLLDRLAKSLEG